jgi:hypothetical protein
VFPPFFENKANFFRLVTYIFEISKKNNYFDVSIGIKISFFRVSVTILPGRSLLTVRHHELFERLDLNTDPDFRGKYQVKWQ